jgi:hypothetical protein
MRLARALLFAAFAMLSSFPAVAHADATFQFRFGVSGRPLEGRRYQTMRALAHYLDERGQYFSGQVFSTRGSGTHAEKKLRSDVSEFARRADHFHERMDNYVDSPYDVPAEVLALERRAQAVSTRLQQSPAYGHTFDEWNDVLSVLILMKRALSGEEVRVPSGHPGFRDYDRDFGPFREAPPAPDRDDDRYRGPGRGEGYALPVRAQEEFRRIVQELDALTNRVRSRSEWTRDFYGPEGERFAADLFHFNQETHLFRERTDSGSLDRRDLARTVDHLIEDARRTNDSMRRAMVFPEIYGDWAHVVELLSRLAQISRS